MEVMNLGRARCVIPRNSGDHPRMCSQSKEAPRHHAVDPTDGSGEGRPEEGEESSGREATEADGEGDPSPRQVASFPCPFSCNPPGHSSRDTAAPFVSQGGTEVPQEVRPGAGCCPETVRAR